MWGVTERWRFESCLSYKTRDAIYQHNLFTFSQLLLNGLAEWKSLNVRSGKIQMAYLLLTYLHTLNIKKTKVKLTCNYSQSLQLQSNQTDLLPVYEAKWLLFKTVWCYVKFVPCICPHKGLRLLELSNEVFYDVLPQGASIVPEFQLDFPLYLIQWLPLLFGQSIPYENTFVVLTILLIEFRNK